METVQNAIPRLLNTDPFCSDIKRTTRSIRERHPHLWKWRERLWNSFLTSGAASYYELICTRCKKTANAEKHSVDVFLDGDIYPRDMGLSCPNCRSDGPFVITPSSWSGESETSAIIRAKRAVPSRAASRFAAAATASSSSNSSSRCFIATAVYGDTNHLSVLVLRSFRDRHLVPHSLGRMAVEAYYRFSPPIANWLRGRRTIATLIRISLLNPIVALVRRLQ